MPVITFPVPEAPAFQNTPQSFINTPQLPPSFGPSASSGPFPSHPLGCSVSRTSQHPASLHTGMVLEGGPAASLFPVSRDF